MKKAVIDIGTNSVKLTLGEPSGGDGAKILCDVNVITRLGEGLKETGKLADGAMERTAAAVGKFAAFAREQGAEEMLCVGTMAMRAAKNADKFASMVKAASGLGVAVLTGEEEAELSSKAAAGSIEGAGKGYATVFDTGGGSTEFVFLRDGEKLGAVSTDAGAVTLTDEYFRRAPADPKAVCAALSALTEKFRAAGVGARHGMLIGTGGNVSAMAAVAARMTEYDPNKIHGSRLSKKEVMEQTALYAGCTREQLLTVAGLPPKRSGIILGGACIILAAMEAAGADALTVSDRSMRHELLRRLCAIDGGIKK